MEVKEAISCPMRCCRAPEVAAGRPLAQIRKWMNLDNLGPLFVSEGCQESRVSSLLCWLFKGMTSVTHAPRVATKGQTLCFI